MNLQRWNVAAVKLYDRAKMFCMDWLHFGFLVTLFLRFEVLTMVRVKITVLWHVTPCTVREICCCHPKRQLCLCGQHTLSQHCYIFTVLCGVRSQQTAILFILLLLQECICICKHICSFMSLPTYTFVYWHLSFCFVITVLLEKETY